MSTGDRIVDRFVQFAMVGFASLGVLLLATSVLNGFDFERFLMGLGSLSWLGLLLLGIQPWRD